MKKPETIFRTKNEVLNEIVKNYDNIGTATSTGYSRLDEAMGGGLYQGKFYTLAARKKTGKTMMLGSISRHLNRAGNIHLWIALEMNGIELEQRQVSRDLKINPIAFLKHRENALRDKVEKIAGNGIANNTIYCDYPGLRLTYLSDVICDAVEAYDIKGVIIDFLQLIGGGSGSEMAVHHDAVAVECSRLAKQLGIWIFAAAQLNQDHNLRGGEGASIAADQLYHLERCEGKNDALWLSLTESRYTPYMDIGSSDTPGYLIRSEGPYMEEMPI